MWTEYHMQWFEQFLFTTRLKIYFKNSIIFINIQVSFTSLRDGGRGIEIEPTGGVDDWDIGGFGVECWKSPTSKNKSPRSKHFYFYHYYSSWN